MIASGLSNIIILVVGAAWAAVLLPPLLRSRVENRPGSSVVDFRKQLATLQRTVPTRGVSPVRSMARPLAPSPRTTSPGARPTGPRQHGHHTQQHLARSGSLHHVPVQRSSQPGQRSHHGQVHVDRRPLTQREVVRQRRQNVLFALVAVTAGSAFLAFTTTNATLTYVFVLSAISLAGYCYKLVQLKRYQGVRAYGEDWFRAA
jgi:hypothetical protein